jgi:hypothetical protein
LPPRSQIIAVTINSAGPARTPLPRAAEHKATAGLLKYRMAIDPIPCCYAQKADTRSSHALRSFPIGGSFAELVGKAGDIRLECLDRPKSINRELNNPATRVNLHLLYADFAHHR